jgi:RimJ/RimL family protein N-acetyltransferase
MHKENTPTLKTKRLILRKFTDNDIIDITELYGDDEVNKFLPWFPIKTQDAALEYLHNKIFPCYEKDIAYNYAISLKSNNKVIGYVNINDIGGSNDIGYALRKEFWNSGITTEACSAVIDRLKQANFPFITATHDVNNPNSGKVMKKLNMTYHYSYKEKWQPKNIWVTFRMYQLNIDGKTRMYEEYKKRYFSFVENDV